MVASHFDKIYSPKKRYKLKLIIFGIFLIVLSLLIYTSFYGLPLTGKIIGQSSDSNKSISVSADLTVPVLALEGNFEEIIIKGSSDAFFYVGDKKFPLSNINGSYIILTDYEGKISFNEKVISKLEGNAMKVSVNGLPMISKSNSKMKIYFDTDFNYDYLEIKEKAFIKKLDYKTSGTIILDEKTTINLNDEDLMIEKFYGNLKIEDKRFKVQGYLKSLSVEGDKQIFVSV